MTGWKVVAAGKLDRIQTKEFGGWIAGSDKRLEVRLAENEAGDRRVEFGWSRQGEPVWIALESEGPYPGPDKSEGQRAVLLDEKQLAALKTAGEHYQAKIAWNMPLMEALDALSGGGSR